MFFTRKKNKFIILITIFVLLIITAMIIIYKKNQYENNFQPLLSTVQIQTFQQSDINAYNSTKLFLYFANVSYKNNEEEAQFWNQMCLFFKTEECVHYSLKYSIDSSYEENRRNSFLSNQEKVPTIVKNDQCLQLYFNSQDGNRQSKQSLLNNWTTNLQCKKELLPKLPLLQKYNNQFIALLEK